RNGHPLPPIQIGHWTPQHEIGLLHLPQLPLSIHQKLIIIGEQYKNPAVDEVGPRFWAATAEISHTHAHPSFFPTIGAGPVESHGPGVLIAKPTGENRERYARAGRRLDRTMDQLSSLEVLPWLNKGASVCSLPFSSPSPPMGGPHRDSAWNWPSSRPGASTGQLKRWRPWFGMVPAGSWPLCPCPGRFRTASTAPSPKW